MSNEKNIQTTNQKAWYIIYTHSRAEKVVLAELLERGYEAYLPLKKELHTWKNRQRKIIHSPLLPNYVFVNTCSCYIYQLSRLARIAAFVRCGNSYLTIRQEEIDALRKMTETEREISVEHDLVKGESVIITNGPLKGYKGILTQLQGRYRFGIYLSELNKTVSIEIGEGIVERIEEKVVP